jgi:hypothetical protein
MKTLSVKEIINQGISELNNSPDFPKEYRQRESVKRKSPQSNNEFWDAYKHPLWQKKRLEIMQRDGFRCVSCDSEEDILNVHHTVPYRKGAKPWEYENKELTTLCENCHKEISEIVEYAKAVIMNSCYCIDTATEIKNIMTEIRGMNPAGLNSVWKIIKLGRFL